MAIVPYYQRDTEGGVPYSTYLRYVPQTKKSFRIVIKMTPCHCDREGRVAGSNPVTRQVLWIAAPSYDGSQRLELMWATGTVAHTSIIKIRTLHVTSPLRLDGRRHNPVRPNQGTGVNAARDGESSPTRRYPSRLSGPVRRCGYR